MRWQNPRREPRESRGRSRRCKGGQNRHKPMPANAGVKEPGVGGSPSQKNCGRQPNRGTMRTTFYSRTALTAVVLGFAAWGVPWAATQDLGVSEISGADYTPTKDANYTEIQSSAWEGKSLTAADLLSALPGVQAYKQGGLGSFQTVSIRAVKWLTAVFWVTTNIWFTKGAVRWRQPVSECRWTTTTWPCAAISFVSKATC